MGLGRGEGEKLEHGTPEARVRVSWGKTERNLNINDVIENESSKEKTYRYLGDEK